MLHRLLAATVAAAALVASSGTARAQSPDGVTLLRVFLNDGTSLVSYGEPARVDDRVIFSMPAEVSANPQLHLINLPIARVDWDRTTRYANAARLSHYVKTRAEDDYAALSNQVATTLNQVAHTADPAQRLAIVEAARKTLADWPENHYGYRQAEVRQMLALLDEAIADLRAARGEGRFDLTLTAFADPPTVVEPLLPPPTLRESIAQLFAAARAVDTPVERASLLATVVTTIDRSKGALPADWAAATRADAADAVRIEAALDRSYQELTSQIMASANYRARGADIPGLERLLLSIQRRDAALGARRPDAVAALVGAVEAKLDAARQLQLARDRWALRGPDLRRYSVAIGVPIDLFGELKAPLENIRSLAGSPPSMLAFIQRRVARIMQLIADIVPPEEMAAAHALLVSAIQLAGQSAEIRREAVLATNITRAWDASSAAAGALMLAARARADIQSALRIPQLR
jgi:hypothetical protein